MKVSLGIHGHRSMEVSGLEQVVSRQSLNYQPVLLSGIIKQSKVNRLQASRLIADPAGFPLLQAAFTLV